MQFITKNKRAYFDYEIEKEYEAGIVLKWHEVKAIKTSHVNIQDAAIVIENRELWIYNMDIPLYEKTSPALVPHYRQKWKRKLLLNKNEITKIAASLDKPWMVALAFERKRAIRPNVTIRIARGKCLPFLTGIDCTSTTSSRFR